MVDLSSLTLNTEISPWTGNLVVEVEEVGKYLYLGK